MFHFLIFIGMILKTYFHIKIFRLIKLYKAHLCLQSIIHIVGEICFQTIQFFFGNFCLNLLIAILPIPLEKGLLCLKCAPSSFMFCSLVATLSHYHVTFPIEFRISHINSHVAVPFKFQAFFFFFGQQIFLPFLISVSLAFLPPSAGVYRDLLHAGNKTFSP